MNIKINHFSSKFAEASNKIPLFLKENVNLWLSSKNTPLFTNFRPRMHIVVSLYEGAGFVVSMAYFYMGSSVCVREPGLW